MSFAMSTKYTTAFLPKPNMVMHVQFCHSRYPNDMDNDPHHINSTTYI